MAYNFKNVVVEVDDFYALGVQKYFGSSSEIFFSPGGPIALIIVIAYTTYILGPSALLGCFIYLIMFPVQVCKNSFL